ncbi:MAG TPA: DUF5010 domain-containing protein [Candidatus Paceibacterota bacterium]|nr:DUF5010 domain-containing protein [Candidatus Paceibacterota bacterium]
MAARSRMILAAGLVCLVAGLIIECGLVRVQGMPALHVVFPLGAILLGVYLVARTFGLACLLWLPLASLGAAVPAREIPPAFGPYINLSPRDFAEATSFKETDRIVGTYYFYWYNIHTGEHITNPQNGSDGLTDHPPTLEDFSYLSVRWHKRQFSDMEDAGIDVALPVFWGAPSERDPKASLHWSYAGLGPMVQAREELVREGKKPPRLGLFYDTSTLQYNAWHVHVDLKTDFGKRWFYATVRDFFSAIPPKHWALMDGKAVVLLYSAAFAKDHDQGFVEFTRNQFRQEFGGHELYFVPQDSWRVKGDNVCAWGGALGLKNPGVGALGPGYDDTAVYGRKPLVRKREGGKFYEDNWTRFLRRPSNFVMVETWNEFHEGTTVCESREYGRQYIELTRKYSDLFKQGWVPAWPKGRFSDARRVTATPLGDATTGGLTLVPHEDGQVRQAEAGGSVCWQIQPSPGHGTYVYFRVDDSFKNAAGMDLDLVVEYFDAAAGRLNVEYDGPDKSAPFNGAYSRSQAVPLSGDKQWKTATFKLAGARLMNGQNSGADLRLVVEAGDLGVRKVTLCRTDSISESGR